MVTINGMSLTVEQVAAVARNFEPVQISEDAKQKINKARAYVETKLDEKAVVYGLTTGFGKFSDKYISIEDTAQLQRNLIISHSCGMGDPLPTEAVRAAMLLRCNALCRGNSGIRLSTIETLLAIPAYAEAQSKRFWPCSTQAFTPSCPKRVRSAQAETLHPFHIWCSS